MLAVAPHAGLLALALERIRLIAVPGPFRSAVPTGGAYTGGSCTYIVSPIGVVSGCPARPGEPEIRLSNPPAGRQPAALVRRSPAEARPPGTDHSSLRRTFGVARPRVARPGLLARRRPP